MPTRTYRPCDALSPWVSGFEIIKADFSVDTYSVLPDLEPVMGFQYRGRIRAVGASEEVLLETSGITGIQSGPRRYRNLPGTASVLVRFHPWGAAAFLPAPMEELAGVSVGLESLLAPAPTRELLEQLQAASHDADRIRAVELFLLPRVRARAPDGLLRRAVRCVQAQPEIFAVTDAARRLGLGDRQLERKFREWIGVGPKRFARLARFRAALQKMTAAPQRASAALDVGYYDQAHFIKDFRAFAGATPAAFLRDLRASRPDRLRPPTP